MPTQPPRSFPTDSYAQAPERQVPQATAPTQAVLPHTKPSHPDSLEASSTPAVHYTSWTERFLHGLFLLFLALAVLGILVWLYLDTHSKVISRQSIGHFQRMSGPGGLQNRVVIETETGSYPLMGSPVIAKSTPLSLEVRASGYRYICDETRSLCVQTTADEFKASNPSKGATP